MKEEFEAYLNDINVAQPVKNRVDVILKEISSLYEGLVITDIFVCQVKNEEVNYTSLWLFGAGFCIECKDFLSQDDFDLAYLNGNVYYMTEPTLKSKACFKCLYFTKIISDLCRCLEYFSYLYTINQTE